MEKIGENDEKPYYSGWFNGAEKFLYWAWDRKSNPTNAVAQAVPGNWFFGSTVGDLENAISSSTTFGLSHCPTDPQVKWITFNTTVDTVVSLKAGQNNYHNWKFTSCCDVFMWKVPGMNDPVKMEKPHWGAKIVTDERSFYTGKYQGVEHFLYFKFEESHKAPWESRYGRWYIGKVLDDPKSALFVSDSWIMGSKSCPNDPFENLWREGTHQGNGTPKGKPVNEEDFNLKCEEPETTKPKLRTCDSEISNKDFFYQEDPDKCIWGEVVQKLVETQLQQLLFYRKDGKTTISTITPIANAVRHLTSAGCVRTFGANKYIERGCEEICKEIKEIERPRDMKEVLNQIRMTFFRNIAIWETRHKRNTCLRAHNDLNIAINKFMYFTGYRI